MTQKFGRLFTRNGIRLKAEGLGLKKKSAEFGNFTLTVNRRQVIDDAEIIKWGNNPLTPIPVKNKITNLMLMANDYKFRDCSALNVTCAKLSQQRISDHQADSLVPTHWKTISLNSGKLFRTSHYKWVTVFTLGSLLWKLLHHSLV